MPTPRTDALNEELHGRYYAHAFGGPYDTMLSHAEELEAALTAAESRASRAEEDAERYRWLRSQPMRDGHALVSLTILDWNEDGPTDTWYSYDGTALDAAIDAARGKE